jgi:hypothetical protein
VLTLKNALGQKVSNYKQSYVPQITWKPSEFSTFRASYQWEWEEYENHRGVSNSFLQVQTTFILGAHTAHEFKSTSNFI